MKIPITRPCFDQDELEAIRVPLESGWVVQGPQVQRFEEAVADFTGAAHAVACSSGTAALHLALAALDVGPGDEVIVPAFTWISTANVVLYCGATPVFCDIDLSTFNIDVDDARAKLSERSRAIMPVHLFGLPAQLDALTSLADEFGIELVEDAACALGASIDGNHIGTTGRFGTFSFHPRKAITTGEGGMVVTQDAQAADRLRALRSHGATLSTHSRHEGKAGHLLSEFNLLGFNYRMTDLQAALGVSQMAKLEGLQSRRRQRAQRYDELLATVDWLVLPHCPPELSHSYQSYVCLFRPEAISLANLQALHLRRNQLMTELETVGIATRQGTHAAHACGLYRTRLGLRPEDLPQAWTADRLSIALPLYPQMTDAEQDYVVEHLIRLGPMA